MRTGKLLAFGCFAAIGVGLMSCSKADVFDSNAANELKKEQQEKDYTSNFVKKYGAVEGKSWDFATMASSYTMESNARALTRGADVNDDATKGEMIIEQNITEWMVKNMKAGDNNVKKGSPFYLQVPANSFTIVPIFQGTASYYWQLWMHVDGLGDKLVWSKGEDIVYKEKETSDWKSPGTGNAGISKTAYQVKAPTYEFANLPVNANMYFYLKVWDSYGDFQNKSKNPRILSSLNQMMLALMECPTPANVPEGNEVSIIGCEDNAKGDFDYEDLVFMMYGNPVPPIKHVDEVIISETKRYMMEDLGETDDFDFNDVVVDVSNRAKYQRKYKILENGGWELISETKVADLPQQAVVRAAGGTLGFTLKIGDTEWIKPNSADMVNTGWNGSEINYGKELAVFEVKGWKPADNNVSVTVAGKQSGDVKTIGFPKTGEAPMIIAVDPTTDWMVERTSVPTSWFTE